MMNSILRRAMLAGSILVFSGTAFGQSAGYLDDRSSAEAVVRSLYNAIDRREYARAWDYFGDTKPAKDFNTFVKGYEKTEKVDLLTGSASEEGAAGSIFYEVPVAIVAKGTDGSQNTFAGCYTARLVQPGNQAEPPFRPIRLEKGALKPADGPLADVLPASCGDGPAPPDRDAAAEKIAMAFKATYADTCQTLAADAEPDAAKPEIHELSFRYKGADPSEPERKARLFRFQCIYGAYNTNEVYYLQDDTGEFRQLQFTEPELDIHYENNDSEGKLESVTIVGFRATDTLVNSEYDETTNTVTSFSKWRGVGDASSTGTYLFRDGAFSLVKYDVDASYDGEINPETVVDYDTAP